MPSATPLPPPPLSNPPAAGGSAARPTPTPGAQKHAPQGDATLAHVIDTIEAIIIALIVALTFRAFIVEAFVIPTGSMAPTLLGAHFKVICPSCGFEFDRDARLDYQLRPVDASGHLGIAYLGQHTELTSNRTIPCDNNPIIYCPNCMYPINPRELPDYLGTVLADDSARGRNPMGSPVRNVPFAWANNGDRILVLKYLYSIMEPSRWDVIVFKEPQGARDNYIKRLIGLPGETIEIINGDIYVAPAGSTAESERVIQRKPEHLQQFLWQNVYDNDFYPSDEGKPRPSEDFGIAHTPWVNPWVGDTDSWSKGMVMTRTAPGPDGLRFVTRGPYTENCLGYNDDMFPSPQDPPGHLHPVGDLHLEALWTPTSADARSLGMTLGLPNNRFRVTWNDQGVALEQYTPGTNSWRQVEKAAHEAPVVNHAYQVTMNNVDRAVQVYIDGQRVLLHETPWTAADAHRLERQRPEELQDNLVRIDVSGPCTLAHLKLKRDLYYTQSESQGSRTANDGNPLTLHADEFFAMGDNSRSSLDGRLWTEVYPALDDLGTRPGIVPRRYLLGKAFFVYWPAGYRPTSNPNIPIARDLPLVPNVGDMRFIR